MKRTLAAIAALVATVSVAAAYVSIHGEGVVTNTPDVSHIVLQSEGRTIRLRLAGVSTQSMSNVSAKAARAWLSEQILGSNVVFFVVTGIREGEYHRAWVASADRKININIKLIESGWGRAEDPVLHCPSTFPGETLRNREDSLRAAEKRARGLKLGIWKDKGSSNQALQSATGGRADASPRVP